MQKCLHELDYELRKELEAHIYLLVTWQEICRKFLPELTAVACRGNWLSKQAQIFEVSLHTKLTNPASRMR